MKKICPARWNVGPIRIWARHQLLLNILTSPAYEPYYPFALPFPRGLWIAPMLDGCCYISFEDEMVAVRIGYYNAAPPIQ